MSTLISVDSDPRALEYLYRFLQERPPEANISHKKMPSWDEHCAFVMSKPYQAWYLIYVGSGIVGSIYLTRNREVGIHVTATERGKGYGGEAVAALRRLHPGPLLANVAPTNHASILFFKRMGAKHIQNTYEL